MALLIVIFLTMSVLSLNFTGITGAIVADVEVSSDVRATFAAGNEEVSVIVLLKDDAQTISANEEEKKEAIKEKQEKVLEKLSPEDTVSAFGLLTEEKEFELEYQYETLNVLAGKITEEGLKELQRNRNVEAVTVNKIRHLFLSGSVPLVNADDVWKVMVDEHNITGEGETVCVVDTGVDYNHTALSSRYAAGYDFYNNDSDPLDDQGHGTHTAGIVASTDAVFRGIAPGAKIAVVKVCSSSGSCPDADVLAGMDWCMTNRNIYNISVISISLGGGQFTSYCDGDADFAPYAAAINDAVAKNITVVAATGNSGAGSVSGPACVQNATRVTATTKSDTLARYASRHSFFTDIIAAPGSAITSLKKGGETLTMSGTSMATPHVSGAIALMKQYWKLAYGKELTPEQFEQRIVSTGTTIFDASTAKNYSRLDVLAALLPLLRYAVAPENGAILNSTVINLSISSDVDLVQAWLEWTYPNGTTANISLMQQTPTEYWLYLAGLSKGVHSYNVFGSDAGAMTGSLAQQSFTIDNIAPLLFLQNPLPSINLSEERYRFSTAVQEEHSSVSAVWFIITNVSSTNSTLENVSTVYSAMQSPENDAIWSFDLNLSEAAEGRYFVTASANDTLGNENKTEAVLFTVDRTAPAITLLNSSFNTTSSVFPIAFYVDDVLSSVADCTLAVDGNDSSNTSTFLTGMNVSVMVNVSQNVSPSVGLHTVQVKCDDASGNVGVSEEINVTIVVPPSPPSYFLVELKTPSTNAIYSREIVLFTALINSSENISAVNFSITDDSGIKSFSALGNSSEWTAWINMSLLSEGNHTVTVWAEDISGKVNNSVSALFTVDRTSPLLTSIAIASVSQNSAQVSWTTDEPANATVHYGTSANFGTIKSVSATDLSHQFNLSNLAASTRYYYSVASCDAVGNCNISEVQNFTTLAAPPPAPDDGDDEEEDDSDDESSSDSSSSSGSSGSGGSVGGGGSAGDSSSSSSSEELTEAEIEEIEEVPEEAGLQIAASEESSAEESVEEQQTAEDGLTVAAVAGDDANDRKKGLGNLLTGFVSAAVFGDLSSREYILIGLTALSVILTIAFILIRKRANEF